MIISFKVFIHKYCYMSVLVVREEAKVLLRVNYI